MRRPAALLVLLLLPPCNALLQPARLQQSKRSTRQYGWFDNLWGDVSSSDPQDADRRRRLEYPEQYPATYELLQLDSSNQDTPGPCQDCRPLLKQTQLEQRPLQVAYDAHLHGWSSHAFHQHVDGKGAAVVMATGKTTTGNLVNFGGYNPKGWASMGGARPSVAAFLFYETADSSFQKLRKVGGGGLACARDEPNFGISLGPDALVIPLQPPGRERTVSSKLGPYYERGPDGRTSVFGDMPVLLTSLHVVVGVYDADEDIPYSGAVLDMTSG